MAKITFSVDPITASLADLATNSISSSYSTTSSYSVSSSFSISGSYALSASWAPSVGGLVTSASYSITSSFIDSPISNSQVTASNLQIGHIINNPTGSLTITSYRGVGSPPTTIAITGSDVAGLINVKTSAVPFGNSPLFAVTYSIAYPIPPAVILGFA